MNTSCRSRDSNPQPWVTSGFKSNALSIRPTTAKSSPVHEHHSSKHSSRGPQPPGHDPVPAMEESLPGRKNIVGKMCRRHGYLLCVNNCSIYSVFLLVECHCYEVAH